MDYSPKRLNYEKYLVGNSIRNFLTSCGCDDTEDILTKTPTVMTYRIHLYHMCEDIGMNTDQIVKKYKKLHRFSYEFGEILREKCLRIRAELNKKETRNGKAIMKSGSKIKLFIHAWQKFCKSNGIIINWDSLLENIPRKQIRREADDDAYISDQIRKMLKFATDIRVQVAILFMSSSGIRREAMTILQHKHVVPVEVNGEKFAKIITYNEEEGSTYTTFISPEAYNRYLEYLEQRKRNGDIITGDSYVLIKKLNVDKGTINNSKIENSTLNRLIERVLIMSGVRERSDSYSHRYKVKMLHGFRSFFYETLKKVRKNGIQAIPTEICHTLLGDKGFSPSSPMDRNYDKKTDEEFTYNELLQAYILGIPDLTISNEAREKALRIKTEKELKDTKTLELEIQKIRKEHSDEIARLDEIIRKYWVESAKETINSVPDLNVSETPKAKATPKIRTVKK